MRIFTCTPVPFDGDAYFFTRDSGLLCRGLQAIGVESRAVMPGPRKPDDEEDLIRTDYDNLESAVWWRSQNLHGVVLYAWGRPKFRKVAAAIREAEIFLILNLDSGGPVSPLAGGVAWLRAQWNFSGQGRGPAAWIRFAKFSLRGLTVGLLLTDPLRAQHLRCGDVVASVSPGSAAYFRRLCLVYGGKTLSARVEVIPHAVEPRVRYSGVAKSHQVVCIGRWSDHLQKRSWLLMRVMKVLLSRDRQVTVVVAGEATTELEAWHRDLRNDCRERVKLAGIIGREELAVLLDESRIFYSSSAYESFGIAAAEALCSGASVVAGRSVTMPAFDWFISEESGQLAESDDDIDHANVLMDELERWKGGQRNPQHISDIWCGRVHADQVARRVLELHS